MVDDPLAQFRKSPQIPAGGIMLPPAGIDEYMAFGTKDKVNRLRIHSALAPTHAPSYNILLDVISDVQHGTNCVLVYTVMMVLVRGKNLQKMVFAIENGMSDFIQQFDPDRWQKPKDAEAAFIESIEIKVTDGSMATNETKH
jgi:hypothetical protein